MSTQLTHGGTTYRRRQSTKAVTLTIAPAWAKILFQLQERRNAGRHEAVVDLVGLQVVGELALVADDRVIAKLTEV